MLLSDVTLREGDQMPGRSFTVDEKIDCAHKLDSLNVPFVQAGFPVTGEKDQEVIRELAETVNTDVIGLARALEGDIDAAIDANADIVEVIVPASDRHLEHLVGVSREEMLSMLIDAADYIRERGGVPHIILADAFRTKPEDIIEICKTAPDVPYITLADSVGARTPATTKVLLEEVAEQVDLSRIGVHFHDDMGCGTANALVAYNTGVGKADVSVAGLGERAGNSVLEEVVVSCTVDYGDNLQMHTEKLIPVCQEILERLGEEYDERKAVIGQRVTEQESGMHTSAMLSDPATLEPFDPTRFGGSRRLIFGEGTGKGGARKLLEKAGINASDETISAFQEVLATEGPLEMDDAIALAEHKFQQ